MIQDLPSGFIDIDILLSDPHPEAKNVLVSYAQYFSTIRITEKTAPLFLKLLSSDVQPAAERLFSNKNPLLFFSSVTFNREGISKLLETMTSNTPETIYIKTLLAYLGVLLKTYKHAETGMKLYPLSIPSVQHIAKYLTVPDETVQKTIIEILENLKALPSRYSAAAFSAQVLDAFFDNSKNLENFLPRF